jgi:hypothetical protein
VFISFYLCREKSEKGRLNLKNNGLWGKDRDLCVIKTKTIGLLCKISDV